MKPGRQDYQSRDFSATNTLRRLQQETRQRKRALIKLLLGAAILVIMANFCLGPFGTVELIRVQQRKRLMEDKLRRLSAELTDLQIEADRLTDTLHLEKLAREKYLMSKPGEIIIKLTPSPNATK